MAKERTRTQAGLQGFNESGTLGGAFGIIAPNNQTADAQRVVAGTVKAAQIGVGILGAFEQAAAAAREGRSLADQAGAVLQAADHAIFDESVRSRRLLSSQKATFGAAGGASNSGSGGLVQMEDIKQSIIARVRVQNRSRTEAASLLRRKARIKKSARRARTIQIVSIALAAPTG